MKALLCCLLLLHAVAWGREPFFIAASPKDPAAQGIYRSELDGCTLAEPTLAAPLERPAFLALSPDGKHLYASFETGEGGAVAAFSVGPGGTLEPLNRRPSGGKTACHLAIAPSGRHVFVANYSSASVAVLSVEPDGSLGERTALLALTGSGADARRQAAPHPHAVAAGPDARFVYAADLGADRVRRFRFDANAGTLKEEEGAPVPPGGGPRHFAFTPGGERLYACNEMGLGVTAFSRDAASGALRPLRTVSTLPEGAFAPNATTAEIGFHPSGRWLYVSNREHGSIATFEVEADGALRLLEAAPAGVRSPWSFALSREGRAMIVAGRADDRVVLLSLDPATGRLSPAGAEMAIGKPVCVLFAPEALAPAAGSGKASLP